MERIKQALEKARLQRQLDGAAPASSRPVASTVSGPVAYTHTRTVGTEKKILQERRIISGYEQNSFTDAYKILRTQVFQRLRDKGWNSLAVTSPGDNEGKTLTAVNLAISLAMEVDYTVLLVDADLRQPSVHTYFGIDAEYGLSDYLTADKPLSELLVHPAEIPHLVLLPGGKPLANSSEMLNSPKMSRLVSELKKRYPTRIILFDLPPLLSTADAMAFIPYVDAAVLVIEEAKTQADAVKRAVGLLQGTNLLGTVLNKSWVKAPGGDSTSVAWPERLQSGTLLFRNLWAGWSSRLRSGKR